MTSQQLSYTSTTSTTSTFSIGSVLRHHVLPSMIDSGLPFVCYLLVKNTLHTSDTIALTSGAVVPVMNMLFTWLRTRRLNIISLIILISLVASLAMALIGGTPQLLLIRESFVGGLFGLAFLASLALPRPLFFLIIRYIKAGQDPLKIPQFDQQWQLPAKRFRYRLVTTIWGIVMLGELALRIFLVLTLPVATVLALTGLLFPCIYLGTLAWTIWYLRSATKAEKAN